MIESACYKQGKWGPLRMKGKFSINSKRPEKKESF